MTARVSGVVVVGRGRPPPRPGGPDPMLLVLALVEREPLPPGVTVLAHVQATREFRSTVVRAGHGIASEGSSSDDEGVALTLRLADAGKLIDVSESTIRRLIKKGELPVIEVGGQRRVAREDLQRYIDAHRRGLSNDSQGAA